MIPIVDTHQHLWDLSRFQLPWLAGAEPIAHSYLMEDYLEAADGLNIVKTVYMEVDVDHAQRPAEAAYVLELCEKEDNPMTAAVIGGDPSQTGFEAYARSFSGSPYIKGFRTVLHGEIPKGYCIQLDFVRGIRVLGDLGLSFDLCLRVEDLTDGAKLADLCPETQFILDHCGNADVQSDDLTLWERNMAVIARCPNMICKISGIVASAAPEWRPEDLAPIIDHTAQVFGADRIMFASDWPVCTLRASLLEWIEALKTIVSDWPESNQRKLFHDNAVDLYGLG